jgi:hypothetical protein
MIWKQVEIVAAFAFGGALLLCDDFPSVVGLLMTVQVELGCWCWLWLCKSCLEEEFLVVLLFDWALLRLLRGGSLLVHLVLSMWLPTKGLALEYPFDWLRSAFRELESLLFCWLLNYLVVVIAWEGVFFVGFAFWGFFMIVDTLWEVGVGMFVFVIAFGAKICGEVVSWLCAELAVVAAKLVVAVVMVAQKEAFVFVVIMVGHGGVFVVMVTHGEAFVVAFGGAIFRGCTFEQVTFVTFRKSVLGWMVGCCLSCWRDCCWGGSHRTWLFLPVVCDLDMILIIDIMHTSCKALALSTAFLALRAARCARQACFSWCAKNSWVIGCGQKHPLHLVHYWAQFLGDVCCLLLGGFLL